MYINQQPLPKLHFRHIYILQKIHKYGDRHWSSLSDGARKCFVNACCSEWFSMPEFKTNMEYDTWSNLPELNLDNWI